jgi:hypothetical protein
MATHPSRLPNPADDDNELVKVSLNLPRSVLRKVEALAQKTGFNKTTVIRRAIDLDVFLDDVHSRGGKILVKEKGDDLKEVIFR